MDIISVPSALVHTNRQNIQQTKRYSSLDVFVIVLFSAMLVPRAMLMCCESVYITAAPMTDM